jgi:hypothetical protein
MNLKNLLNPLSQNMHLIIIGIYAYVLLCHVKENDYISMVLLTAATCMAICYLKKNNELPLVEGQNGSSCLGGGGGVDESAEGFDNPPAKKKVGQDVIRQLPSSMGPFDGLCLQTGNKEHWMKSPDNTALIPNDALFSYLSSQGPLKPVFTDNSALFGPPIDGQDGSAKKMFMFANNRTSPNCCPGTFSTSTGCVCTTENQRDFIASRGHQGSIKLENI